MLARLRRRRCPYCGSALFGEDVICAGCQEPAHLEAIVDALPEPMRSNLLLLGRALGRLPEGVSQ